MDNKIKIYYYALCCPMTGTTKYIGRTVNPSNRLRNHIYEAKKRNKNKRERWIMSLINKGTPPLMKILWNGYLTLEDAIRIEKKLISVYRKSFDLKNGNDHGLGGKISTKYVHQYSLDGTFIKTFINANQASISTGIEDANISRCCYSNKPLMGGGFMWSFNKYDTFPEKYNEGWRRCKGKVVIRTDSQGNSTMYKTARMASEDTGISYKRISACCNGRQKTAGGYLWSFQ